MLLLLPLLFLSSFLPDLLQASQDPQDTRIHCWMHSTYGNAPFKSSGKYPMCSIRYFKCSDGSFNHLARGYGESETDMNTFMKYLDLFDEKQQYTIIAIGEDGNRTHIPIGVHRQYLCRTEGCNLPTSIPFKFLRWNLLNVSSSLEEKLEFWNLTQYWV